MAKSGELPGLGALAGLGQGLSAGTSQMLQFGLTIREQNMKIRLGAAQLGVQLKRLAHDKNESTRLQQRYYDGLRHNDLMKSRDIRARRRIQEMADEAAMVRQKNTQAFTHEENILIHGRAMEQQDIVNKSREKVAGIQAHPRNVANELVRRAQDFDTITPITQRATQMITNYATDPDTGEISQAAFQKMARELGFLTPEGEGNSAALAAQLHSEIVAANKATFGEDAPQISFFDTQGLIHGVLKGDTRGFKKWSDGITRGYVQNLMVLPARHAQDTVLHATNGSSAIPFRFTDTGDLVLDGASAEAMNEVIAASTESGKFPTGPVSDMTMDKWIVDFNQSWLEATGMDLGAAGKRSDYTPEELTMFEVLFKAKAGMPFPVPVSGRPTNEVDLVESMVRNSQGLQGAIDQVGDIPGGTTRKQARLFGSMQSRIIGSQLSTRERFSDAMNAGDFHGMANELQSSTAEYESALETAQKLGNISSNKAMEASLADWRELLDSMSRGLTTFGEIRDADIAKGTTAGIQELEARYGVGSSEDGRDPIGFEE